MVLTGTFFLKNNISFGISISSSFDNLSFCPVSVQCGGNPFHLQVATVPHRHDGRDEKRLVAQLGDDYNAATE